MKDLNYIIEPLSGGYLFTKSWYDETDNMSRYKSEKQVFTSLSEALDLIKKSENV